jgi:hypothetical protein
MTPFLLFHGHEEILEPRCPERPWCEFHQLVAEKQNLTETGKVCPKTAGTVTARLRSLTTPTPNTGDPELE